MRPSNIELEGYFVTELNISANLTFDAKKPTGLTSDDLVTEPECLKKTENPRHWQIRLKVKNAENGKPNTPYFFSIALVGFFKVMDAVPDQRVAEFAKVNGASILFGTAREVLRNAMSQGPYAPILLPAVCFLDAMPEASSLPVSAGGQTGVTVRKKRVIKKTVTKQKPE